MGESPLWLRTVELVAAADDDTLIGVRAIR